MGKVEKGVEWERLRRGLRWGLSGCGWTFEPLDPYHYLTLVHYILDNPVSITTICLCVRGCKYECV